MALSSGPHIPHLWLRFVDDTFVINKAEHCQQLLHHINNQDPNTQSTEEEPPPEGTLPFLNTLLAPAPSNTLITKVYRKPIHMEQYLHWDSNHFIAAKHGVYNTLAHRVKIVSTKQESLHKELNHIRKSLQACHVPHVHFTNYNTNLKAKTTATRKPDPRTIHQIMETTTTTGTFP